MPDRAKTKGAMAVDWAMEMEIAWP